MAVESSNESLSPNLPTLPATSSYFAVGLWLLLIVASAITIGVITVGYYRVKDFQALGTWGDFAGGLLNPILTFITFLAVILTLWLQRQELSLTRDEMARSANALEQQAQTLKHQSFEKTFFEMLGFHNSIVDSIDLLNAQNGRVTKGRDTFNVFYNRFSMIYNRQLQKSKIQEDGHSILKITKLSYSLFWKETENELGHYFRFLFNFFRFIEKSDIKDSFYPKLLRSQLSNQELLILFYNNITDKGSPFQKYADMYELFDNLPVERLLEKIHADFANKESYGNNSMDFHPT